MKLKVKYSLLKHIDFVALDIFFIELSFFLACMVRYDTFIDLMERYVYMSIVLLIAYVFIALFWNIYSGILRRNFGDEFKSVFALVAGVFVALTLYCFITKTAADYSRAVLLSFFSISIFMVYIERLIRKELVRKCAKKVAHEVLLFIREDDATEKIKYFSRQAEDGVIVTGIVTYEKSEKTEIGGIPVVSDRNGIFEYIKEHDVESVYIYLNDVKIHKYVDYLVRNNVVVYRALRNLEKSSYRYSIIEMNGYKTLCIREREQSLGFVVSKRLVDIMVAFIALVCSSPIMLMTAIAIKIEDGGNVMYKSKRIGRYGKPFYIYKFRSMKKNADKLEDMLTKEELEKYHKEFKLDNDPRITRVGEFIRKHSIDELPQFINILIGDMAFIGPRPLVEDEVKKYYSDNSDILLSLKPGLTGYWQAYARNNVGYENGGRQKMELYYIQHSCWSLDIRIIIRTIKIVFTGEGAQ